MAFTANSETRMKKVKLFMDELFPGKLQIDLLIAGMVMKKIFIPVYELVEKVCEEIISSKFKD